MKRPINDLGPVIMRDCLDRNEKVRSFSGTYKPYMTKKDLWSCWMVLLAVIALVVWVVENH